MKNLPEINMRSPLIAMHALVSAAYALTEELGLFVGPPDLATPTGKACWHMQEETCRWCSDALFQAQIWDTCEVEQRGDVVAAEVTRRAAAVLTQRLRRDAEAFFVWSLVLAVDEFSAIWKGLGRSWTRSPLPELRAAAVECLAKDYTLDLQALRADQMPIHSAAQDLVRQWRTWATSQG